MLNRVPTRYSLMKRRILAVNEQGCTTNYDENEDVHHLLVKCDFFDKIGYVISNWLGFYTTFNGSLVVHITQFDSLGGLHKKFETP